MDMRKFCGVMVVLFELPILLTIVCLPALMAVTLLQIARSLSDVLVSVVLVSYYMHPTFRRIVRGFLDDFRLMRQEMRKW